MTDFNLDHGAALYRRYAKLFWAIFLSVLVAVIVVTLLTKPRYEAKAQIIVEAQQANMLPRGEEMAAAQIKGADIIGTHVEALYNPEIAKRVIGKLKLSSNSGNEAEKRLSENIKIYQSGESYLINIEYLSDDATRAAQITNSYVQTYLELQKEAKRSETESATAALSERIDEMAQSLENAENQVQRYKIANGLMSVNGATLAEQTVAVIDNDLARARAEEKAALDRLASARKSGARVAGAQTPTLENLLSQQAAAEQNWQEAGETYGPQHPRYQEAEVKLAALNRAISREKQRARNIFTATYQQDLDQLTADARAVAGKRGSLEASIGNTQTALSSTNKAQVQLNALQRDAEAKRAIYEAYLARYQETATRLGAEQPDVSIAVLATIASAPSEPNILVNLIFGNLLGLTTALAAVGLVSSMNTTFGAPAEIEKYLDVDSLPSLPELDSGMTISDYLTHERQTVFSEQYNKLLAAILSGYKNSQGNVIAITSALSDEGKTTATIMLAREASLSGLKCLIMDCDYRRDSDESLTNTSFKISTLDAPTIKAPDMFEALLEQVRGKYDLIFLDLPAILPVADTRKIAPLADKIIMLCQWRSTPRKAVEDSLRILANGGVSIAGVSLSRVDWPKQVRQGYGDPAFHVARYGRYE